MKVEFELKEGCVYIYKDDELIVVQPFNPETGKKFSSVEEAERFFQETVEQIVPPEFLSSAVVSSTSTTGFFERVINFLKPSTTSSEEEEIS